MVSSTSTAPHIISSVMNKEAMDNQDFKECLSFEAQNVNTEGMLSVFLIYENQSLQL